MRRDFSANTKEGEFVCVFFYLKARSLISLKKKEEEILFISFLPIALTIF